MSLKDAFSGVDLAELELAFQNLKNIGIVDNYDLKNGLVKISSTLSLIRRMEKHVFHAFKIAFPNRLIRKPAIDLYLASVMDTYIKLGLNKETALIIMMIVLEKEKDENFQTLPDFLKKEFSYFNFEEIKSH